MNVCVYPRNEFACLFILLSAISFERDILQEERWTSETLEKANRLVQNSVLNNFAIHSQTKN